MTGPRYVFEYPVRGPMGAVRKWIESLPDKLPATVDLANHEYRKVLHVIESVPEPARSLVAEVGALVAEYRALTAARASRVAGEEGAANRLYAAEEASDIAAVRRAADLAETKLRATYAASRAAARGKVARETPEEAAAIEAHEARVQSWADRLAVALRGSLGGAPFRNPLGMGGRGP